MFTETSCNKIYKKFNSFKDNIETLRQYLGLNNNTSKYSAILLAKPQNSNKTIADIFENSLDNLKRAINSLLIELCKIAWGVKVTANVGRWVLIVPGQQLKDADFGAALAHLRDFYGAKKMPESLFNLQAAVRSVSNLPRKGTEEFKNYSSRIENDTGKKHLDDKQIVTFYNREVHTVFNWVYTFRQSFASTMQILAPPMPGKFCANISFGPEKSETLPPRPEKN